jgi:serine/threonine protein kinase
MNAPEGEETIFAEALRLPPQERAAYLDRATSGNAELRQRIESLLGSYGAGDFLEQAAVPQLRRTLDLTVPVTEKPGETIGRYKLREQIGEGGCGVVYVAEQTEPVRRRVALKIIKLGMDTKSVIARFEAERQALALMDHPNIAKVFDAGATETGRPYFVMELVRGMKITEYCDGKKLSTRERLDLFIQVCQAIQHAHQKGIIHRDIKPSNILVTVNDGVAVPKVIDFGIAKATSGQQLTDKTIYTAFEQFIGTPAYMSPEQAVLTSVHIDTRSDIYALGVLLYELLTGKTPFEGKELLAHGLDEMRRTLREKEPVRPSTRLSTLPEAERTTAAQHRDLDAPKLTSQLRGDLDWIVMKALEKDRARRYQTANSFAHDLQRYLNNEPVTARPASRLYQFQKLVRRNKLAVVAIGAVAAVLLIGLFVSTIFGFRERAARVQATAAERKAERALTESNQQRDNALKEQRRADEQAAIAQAVSDFLQNDLLRQADVMNQAESGFTTEPDLTIKQALRRASETVEQRFAGQPLVRAAIWHTLASSFWSVGEPRAGIELMERSVALRREHAGATNQETIGAMNGLAVFYRATRQEAKALSMYEQVLHIREATLGSNHVDALAVVFDIAETHYSAGRLAEAERLHERTLELRRAQLPPDHPHIHASMHSLGRIYQDTGRLNEAVALFEETLRLRRAARGLDHLRTLETMTDLAAAYSAARRTNEAVRTAAEALALTEKKLGPDHPEVALRMRSLGATYLATGRTSEAIALLEETLRRQKARMGPEHKSSLATRTLLAKAYQAAGRHADALSLAEEVVTIRSKQLGPTHVSTMLSKTEVARVWAGQRKFAEAEPLLLSVYEALDQQSDGAFRTEMKSAATELVQLYSNWNRPAEAARWQAKLDGLNRQN